MAYILNRLWSVVHVTIFHSCTHFFPVRSLRSKAILTIFNLIPKALPGKEVAPISSQTKNKDGGNSKPMTSTMEKDIIHCAKSA